MTTQKEKEELERKIEGLKEAVYPNRQYGKGWIDACDHIIHYFLHEGKVKSAAT